MVPSQRRAHPLPTRAPCEGGQMIRLAAAAHRYVFRPMRWEMT